MQADLLTSVILPAALFLIMFGMGLSLQLTDFKRVLTQPKAAMVGLSAQLLLLPMVAFILAVVLALPPELAVGLMIIAFAPGGATSNMFTYLAKGDVALSISLTAVVSLITPFTLPLLTFLSMSYFMAEGTQFELPLMKTIAQLLVITIIPVVLGMWVYRKWAAIAQKIEKGIQYFSVFFLFLIIVLIVLKNKEHIGDFFMQAGLATLLLNGLVLGLGYWVAKRLQLNQAQATAIGFEVGLQNGTLALLVAGTIIGNSTMMIPAVTYSILMFITGFGFAWLMKRQATQV